LEYKAQVHIRFLRRLMNFRCNFTEHGNKELLQRYWTILVFLKLLTSSKKMFQIALQKIIAKIMRNILFSRRFDFKTKWSCI